jgi:NADH:ubiquinone oxidoreductase subunit 5 (subunit L)/multisubunit Na+/H+ antiporter MnhA subunit
VVTPYFPATGKIVWLGTVAAFCTAFYMYRLVYMTFFGKFRGRLTRRSTRSITCTSRRRR